jgi:hypothetical protein
MSGTPKRWFQFHGRRLEALFHEPRSADPRPYRSVIRIDDAVKAESFDEALALFREFYPDTQVIALKDLGTGKEPPRKRRKKP